MQITIDEYMTGHLIVVGDVTTGFEFFGPFEDEMAAADIAASSPYAKGMNWTLAKLHSVGAIYKLDNP